MKSIADVTAVLFALSRQILRSLIQLATGLSRSNQPETVLIETRELRYQLLCRPKFGNQGPKDLVGVNIRESSGIALSEVEIVETILRTTETNPLHLKYMSILIWRAMNANTNLRTSC